MFVWFLFEKEPTPGPMHKECIRPRVCEAGRGADTCQKRRSEADGSDLSLFVQGRKGAQVRHCREASVLLSPWEAGPLPSHLSSLGKQGRRRLGDACKFLKFCN